MRTLEELLKTNKRTGEILKSFEPHYRGRELSDVYGRYSIAKQNGYDYCCYTLYKVLNIKKRLCCSESVVRVFITYACT